MSTILRLIAGGWLLTPAILPVSSFAAIIYVQVPEAQQSCLSAGGRLVFPFDLDKDGTNEFEVISGENFTNFINVLPAGGVFSNGSDVHPLLFGESIERYIEGVGGIGQGNRTLLLSYGYDGGQGGPFYDRDAYMGFSLIRGADQNDFYNGWFHIKEIGGFGPMMLEYAYQTEPNIPILAGQVPEPSTYAYLGLGVILLYLRHAKARTTQTPRHRTTKASRTSRWR